MKAVSRIAKYFLIYTFLTYLLYTLFLVLINSSVTNENELLQSFTIFYINLTSLTLFTMVMKSAFWLLPITLNDIPISYELQPVFAVLGLLALGFTDKSIKWVYALFAVILIIFLAYYLPSSFYLSAFQNILAVGQFLVLNFAVYLLYRFHRYRDNAI